MLAGQKFLRALVMQIAQGVGQFRLAQVGEALKEQLSGFVQAHGSLPTTQLRYGGAEVHNRIIAAKGSTVHLERSTPTTSRWARSRRGRFLPFPFRRATILPRPGADS